MSLFMKEEGGRGGGGGGEVGVVGGGGGGGNQEVAACHPDRRYNTQLCLDKIGKIIGRGILRKEMLNELIP